METYRLRHREPESYAHWVAFLPAFFCAPVVSASNWGEPWGAFSWLTTLAVPVPAVGGWGLALVAIVVAVMAGCRFK